jgi:hypothetical protein
MTSLEPCEVSQSKLAARMQCIAGRRMTATSRARGFGAPDPSGSTLIAPGHSRRYNPLHFVSVVGHAGDAGMMDWASTKL